jgi:uncharacterized protein (DUF58 family)
MAGASRGRAPVVPSTAGQGPGDLTLASIVLFTLGAYGAAAGAATGEEAVVAVGVFAFTLFVIGIIWPVVALARIDVDAVAPPDAVVGDDIDVRINVHGRVGRIDVRVLDPTGTWWRTAAPTTGTLPHVATRRGVFSIVRVQVRSSAPLGVFVRTRTLRVELPAPVVVAPRPVRAQPVLHGLPDERLAASAVVANAGAGDSVRAVRPYVPGDPARLVHWPTSARRGELVVREYEPPPAVGIALVIDLRGPDPETVASRAMGIGAATLAAGGVVWCGTAELDGPVGEFVSDTRALGRRLAYAVGGQPAEPPNGWPLEVVS